MNNNSFSLLIRNCKLFNFKDSEKTIDIAILNGIITDIDEISKISSYNEIIDVNGRIITPGFIDVHIQGAGGSDVLDGTIESLRTISQTCTRFGTTSFLGTTVYRLNGDNHHLLLARECIGNDLGGANLLGIHLEGPFISMDKRGMILPECICPPSQKVFKEVLDITKESLRIMTIAPELNGSLEIIRKLTNSRIIASLGHSNSSYEEAIKGIDAGISHVTHLFNAMPALHHRAPGPLLAIFESQGLSVQIIPDGVHLHPGIVRLIFQLIGATRCITITDGMQATGLPNGTYIYNGVEYESKNGIARYNDGTLIGTSLGLIQLVLRFKEFTNCSLNSAIKTVTKNPAKLLGIYERKGSISVGKDADLVILDNDYSIWATIVGGKIVYRKDII